MVSKVTRLQFHIVTYIWKNEHKGRYSIKEGLGEYSRQQQGCIDVERRAMYWKNNSRDNSIEKKESKRKLKSIKNIWRNNTREHEVTQELKKENSLAWEENRIIYIDRQIYIPNNKKLWEQILQ